MYKKIEKFFDALDTIVDEDAPWQDKKKALEDYMKGSERDATNWEEFFSWFLPEEKPENKDTL